MSALDQWTPTAEQIPTVPGKVDGVVSLDPLTLQCRACRRTHISSALHIGAALILSGSGFHLCAPDAGRLCQDCLQAAKDACEKRHDG